MKNMPSDLNRFRKLVGIEPLRILPEDLPLLDAFAHEFILYEDVPGSPAEIVRRIGDADGVLVSTTSTLDKQVLCRCPNLRYVGMCCSLYDAQSANVDIPFAESKGIVVKGVHDYGDEGVREYVVSVLTGFLLGLNGTIWRQEPLELTGLRVGILGMGRTGSLIAEALHFFGAELSYFSRTRKPLLEEALQMSFAPLDALLPTVDVLVTCLHKNTVLLGEREFQLLGDGKILINISIGPAHDVQALGEWLDRPGNPGNYVFGDMPRAIDAGGALLNHPHVYCTGHSAGMTLQAKRTLARKVCANISEFFARDSQLT